MRHSKILPRKSTLPVKTNVSGNIKKGDNGRHIKFRKVPSPSHPARSTVGNSTQHAMGCKKHILKTLGHLSKAVSSNPLRFNDANGGPPTAPALLKECTVLHLKLYNSVSKNNKYRYTNTK